MGVGLQGGAGVKGWEVGGGAILDCQIPEGGVQPYPQPFEK